MTLPTYISKCCREWISPMGYPPMRCVLCGELPRFLRDDPDSSHLKEDSNAS